MFTSIHLFAIDIQLLQIMTNYNEAIIQMIVPNNFEKRSFVSQAPFFSFQPSQGNLWGAKVYKL